MSAQITALAWREELDRVTALPTAGERLTGVVVFLTALDELLTPPDATAAETAALAELEARASQVFAVNAAAAMAKPEVVTGEDGLPVGWSALQALPTFRERTVAGDEDADLERRIVKRERELLVEQEAKRRAAARGFEGTRVVSFDELRSMRTRWLVPDLVQAGGLHFLVGRSNVGKTFIYADMACALALGRTTFGRSTAPTPVMLVLGEGLEGYIDRLDAWCAAHGASIDDLERQLTIVDGASLNDDQSLDRLRETAAACSPELVVFDTWAATSGQVEENDNGLSAETIKRAKSVSPKAATLFAAHPSKLTATTNAPELRGAGALKGSAEVVMTLFDDPDYRPEAPRPDVDRWMSLSTEATHGGKSRNGPTLTLRGIYLGSVELPGDVEGTVIRQVEGEGLSKAAAVIRARWNGTMTRAQYVEAYGVAKETARRQVKAAVDEGVLVVEDETHNGAEKYRLRVPRPFEVGSV